MANLTTLADAKGYIPSILPADVEFDALLERLIAGVSAQFEAETGRSIASAQRTEIRSGTGRTTIVLEHYPVTAVTSVKVNGVVIPKQTVIGDSGWLLLDSRIALVGYTFTEGLGNVEVVYTAGFATVPGDIGQAVVKMVALQFRDQKSVGLQSRSLSGDGVSYSDGPVLAYWRAIVNLYRRPGC
jgi:uncharacterized phiE125 gp8 family phage protein